MTIADLRRNIVECANEMHFEHHGKKCGLDQEIHDSVPVYEIWCGENLKKHSDFDELIRDKFFDGESIINLLGIVEFDFT